MGQERIDINITARTQGLEESKRALDDVVKALNRVQNTLTNTGKAGAQMRAQTQATEQQSAALRKQLDVLKSQTPAWRQQQTALQKAAQAQRAFNKAVNEAKTGQRVGAAFGPGSSSRDAIKDWQGKVKAGGVGFLGKPERIEAAARNFRLVKEQLNNINKSGIASLSTFKALETGTTGYFQRSLSGSEKFRIHLNVLRKDIDSLFTTWQNQAKNLQWTGRQLMVGLSVPIALFGQKATYAFMDVQREWFQLQKVTEFGRASENADQYFAQLKNSIRSLAGEFGIVEERMTGVFRDVAALGIDDPGNIEKWARGITEISALGDVDLNSATEFFRVVNAVFKEGNMDPTSTIEEMQKLNAIADETSLQLADMAAAFPEVAPVMKQMGADASDVAASIAAMYKSGIPATEGAHALKFSLQSVIVPTKDAKEIIDNMGISFFDASGQAHEFEDSIQLAALAMQGLTPSARLNALGELFGKRQSARIQSYFADIARGTLEMQAAQKDGIVTQKEASDFTSDWARSMVASGKLVVQGAQSSAERYEQALQKFKENPATMMAQLKAKFGMVMTDIGAIITPPLLQIADKVLALLEAFMRLPSGIKQVVAGIVGLAATIGPVIFVIAQMKLALSEVGRLATKFIPKGGLKEILPADVPGLLKANPQRSDIFQSEGVFFKDKYQTTATARTIDKRGLEQVTPNNFDEIIIKSKLAEEGIENIGDETLKTGAKAQVGLGAVTEQLDDVSKKINNIDVTQGIKGPIPVKEGVNPLSIYGGGASKAATEAADTFNKTIAPELAEGSMIAGAQAADEMAAGFRSGTKAIKDATARASKEAASESRWGRNAGQGFINSWTIGMRESDGKLKGVFRSMLRPLNPRAIVSDFKTLGTEMNKSFQKPQKGASGLSKIFGGLKGSIGGAATGLMGFVSIAAAGAATFGVVILVIGTLIAVIGGVYLAIKGIGERWDELKERIQPSIDKLKESWESVKRAVSGLVDRFKEIFSTLSDSPGGEDGTVTDQGFWETLADVIAKVIDGFASFVEFIAKVIEKAKPIIEAIGYVVRDVVGLVVSLINGDWKTAFIYLYAYAWEGVRPLAMLLDWLIDAFITAFQKIWEIIGSALEVVAGLVGSRVNAIAAPFIWLMKTISGGRIDIKMPDWGQIGKSIKEGGSNALKSLKDFSIVDWFDQRLRHNLPKVFEGGIKKGGEESKDEGENAGNDIADAVNDGLENGLDGGDAAEKMKQMLADWLSQVKSVLDKQIGDLRKSALAALEKSFEEELKVFDAKIQKIEDEKDAEEKLYALQEYLAKKRELLYRRNLDTENYRRDRALAIYEGRYDDARMLDLEYTKSTKDFNDELSSIEEDRRKELVNQAREAEKDRINELKDAAKERQDIEKEAFEKQLEIITQYTPRTIEEYQNMLNSINGLLYQYGVVQWPEMATSGGARFLDAVKEANENIRQEYAWSGEAAITAWLWGFIAPDVAAILASKIKDSVNSGADAAAGDVANAGGDVADTFNSGFEGGMDKTALEDAISAGIQNAADVASENIEFPGERVAREVRESTQEAIDNGKPVSLWDFGYDMVTGLIEGITGFPLDDKLQEWVTGFINWVKELLGIKSPSTVFMEIGGDIVDGLVEGLGSLATTIEEKFRNAFEKAKNQVVEKFTTIKEKAEALPGEIVSGIGDIGSTIWNNIKTGLATFKDNFGTTFTSIKDKVWEIVENIVGFFVNLPTRISNTITNLANIIQTPFINAINWIKSAWNNTVGRVNFTIPSWVPFVGNNSWSFPTMHSGGVVPGTGEVGAILLGGEGILTRQAMSQLGAEGLAALNNGIIRSLPSGVSSVRRVGENKNGNLQSGEAEYNIYVDTFIGEEEWFKQMADKYDMKINLRKAKSTGSQRRVLSSYNQNNRGSF